MVESRTSDQIPMGAPGSTAKTWRCSCGHVNDKLGPCQSGCGRSRTVTPPASTSSNQRPFQGRVVDWMMETFSMEVCRNTTERNHRFLEEALELVQAMGCTAAEAHMLVDYTFGRPVGDPEQEVGGALVTLAALCAAADISMAELGERELARCWQNIDRIRAKQAGKPRHSPLPGVSPVETTEKRTVFEQARDAIVKAMNQCTGEQRVQAMLSLEHMCTAMIGTRCTDMRPEEPEAVRAGVSVKDPTPPQEIILCAAMGPSGFVCERPKGHPGRHCDGDNQRWSSEKATGPRLGDPHPPSCACWECNK